MCFLAATPSSLVGSYMCSQLWVHLKPVSGITTYQVKLTVYQDTLRKHMSPNALVYPFY